MKSKGYNACMSDVLERMAETGMTVLESLGFLEAVKQEIFSKREKEESKQ